MISNPEEKKIIAYKNSSVLISNEILLARRLKEWLDDEELLKKPFQRVRIFFFTENFSLVPDEYFEIDKQKNLASLLFEKKSNNHFFENKIEKLNSFLFSAVPQDIYNVLNHFFNNNIEIIHPVAHLVNASFQLTNRNTAFLLPTKKYFYLVAFRGNKLLLANCFQISHPNDLIYNIINAFQQLEISRKETELFLAGSYNQNNELKDILKPYFENISHLVKISSPANHVIINNTFQHYLSLI